MPYARRRAPIRRRPATRRFVGRKLNVRQKLQVKRIVGKQDQDKFLDNSSNNNPDPTGVVFKITMPGQGDTESSRDGDQIMLKKLHVNVGVANADTTNFLRMVIVRWRDNDATAPVINDIFQSATPGALGQLNWYNLQSGRMHVICDHRYTTSLNGPAAAQYVYDFYGRKLGKKKVVFNPGVLTGTDMIYVAVVSDSTVVAHPFIGLNWRLTFTDS